MAKSQELLMLQDVWRKAWARPEGMRIRFKSHSGAVRARMQLYNAVKSVKSRKDEYADQVLRDAADGIEIVWEDDLTLLLQKRSKSDMMQGIMEALGTRPEDYVDPEIAESMRKLGLPMPTAAPAPTEAPVADPPGDGLPKLATEHQSNPFYKR